jgi:transposase-like protein
MTNPQMMPAMGPQDADLPRHTQIYLAHVAGGVSMRALSRQLGVHPSTVHRNVRRIEERRDDPLFDEALASMDQTTSPESPPTPPTETIHMSLCKSARTVDDEGRLEREARRILRRLSESKAFLAVAPDAPLAVVFRESVPGRPRQTATVDREVARGFALQDWIACRKQGKVACYEITVAGRAALERMLASDVSARREAQGFRRGPHALRDAAPGRGHAQRDARHGRVPRGPAREPGGIPPGLAGPARRSEGRAVPGAARTRGRRASARGFRACRHGAEHDPELAALPDRGDQRGRSAATPAPATARCGPATASRPRSRRSALGCRTSSFAAAAFWRGSRRRKNGSAGPSAPARWCSRSPCNGWPTITALRPDASFRSRLRCSGAGAILCGAT